MYYLLQKAKNGGWIQIEKSLTRWFLIDRKEKEIENGIDREDLRIVWVE